MKSFVLSSLAVLALVSSGAAMADGFEGSRITCGDHWLSVQIDVQWPESTITMSGDSNPRWTSMQASTLTYPSVVNGETTYFFGFQALGGIPVGINLTSGDGRSAEGVVYQNGHETTVSCVIEM